MCHIKSKFDSSVAELFFVMVKLQKGRKGKERTQVCHVSCVNPLCSANLTLFTGASQGEKSRRCHQLGNSLCAPSLCRAGTVSLINLTLKCPSQENQTLVQSVVCWVVAFKSMHNLILHSARYHRQSN